MTDSLYADSAQARAGTELRQPVSSGGYDWQADADRRERDAVEMRARVLAAVELLATRLRI